MPRTMASTVAPITGVSARPMPTPMEHMPRIIHRPFAQLEAALATPSEVETVVDMELEHAR